MINTNELKIIGNLSSETHKAVSILKAKYGIRSMEETLKFILRVFNSVGDEERLKLLNAENNEEYKVEGSE